MNKVSDSVQAFYDDLAADYHLIFQDWGESVRRHGEMLATLIRSLHPSAYTLYDCSCGIGTQAIGLARHGYRIHVTDLSPAAINRARQEAVLSGVDVTFGVADFRRLTEQVSGSFDVVLSADNALPHLITDDDLQLAVKQMWYKLNPGGLLLISIRDYDQILQERPTTTPVRSMNHGGVKRLSFQLWEWDEANIYSVNHFILVEQEGGWTTRHRKTIYRALQRDELTQFLQDAGFLDIQWHQDVYFQPVVTARRES